MKEPQIVIIDYNVGNTYSVANAISRLGYRKLKISNSEADIKNADALILPGVGAFDEAISNLKAFNLVDLLSDQVLVKKKHLLGICVGMQLLATSSTENGFYEGLNFIPGQVVKLELPQNLPVPHVGWNDLKVESESDLFLKTGNGSNFYFDHSYHFECDKRYQLTTCNYGIDVVAAVNKENIFGVQFHPEKSQSNGLKLFRDFFNSVKNA